SKDRAHRSDLVRLFARPHTAAAARRFSQRHTGGQGRCPALWALPLRQRRQGEGHLMGFFDNLFGTQAADEAAAQNRAAIQGYQNTAGGQLSDYATGASKDITDALAQASGAVGSGFGSAIDANALQRGAYTNLSNLGSKYGSATTMLLNALGV